ncbi:MAG: Glu/Leu/Phe/Val dehydrogenase dimerization domain-containing protein, partial [Acidobacteriota bacterium]
YIVTDPRHTTPRASHPALQPIADALAADRRDFDRHEACFFEIGAESGHLLTAFLHRTVRGQGAGGLRFWTYDTVEALIRDGLRLAKGMGQKNALAGLWWGGGKGVIARRADVDHRAPDVRAAVYRDYGRFVTGLRGCYITAEDVGTTPADMAWIFRTTRHATCIPPTVGGSGNPSRLTAIGVVMAMEAALEHTGQATEPGRALAGKTVAMQGLGNVASFMLDTLFERGVAKVVATDLDADSVARATARFGDRIDARVQTRDDRAIFATRCDILAPNAVGGVLDPETIPMLLSPIVCGAANNQLADPSRDAELLKQRGILYVPDFLANRMGIVNCANEQYGVFDDDPVITAHLDREQPTGVFRRCLEVFERATHRDSTPAEEASKLADELSDEPHPLWGHRGWQIITHLIDAGWDRQPAVPAD